MRWRYILHPAVVALVAVIGAAGYCLGSGTCTLLSPDRQGYRSFAQDQHVQAARQFADPQWRASALFRQGEFEQAAGIWSGFDTAEGAFNHANALLMQGQYESAAQRYSRALELRPGWTEAQENQAIALSRAKALEQEGADMTGGRIGADDITFSSAPPSNEPDSEETEQTAESPGDPALREIWLRQVQTRPADFLRSKFAYQHAARAAGGTD